MSALDAPIYEQVDERTREILERRRASAVVKGRGWLMRRMLLACDLLGLEFAFSSEALDGRVLERQEIAHRIGPPLLARIPAPSRELRSDNRPVMLAESTRAQAEDFRMLCTDYEFACSTGATTLCVQVRERRVDLAGDEDWERQTVDVSPVAIRSLIVGEHFGRMKA